MIKNKINQTQKLSDAIMKDVSDIETIERNAMTDEILQKYEKEFKEKENLLELFQELHRRTESKTDKNRLKSIWKNKELSLHDKACFLAKYIAERERIPSANFIQYVLKTLKILKTEKELNLFLAEPQHYINSHKNLSTYDLQILQFIINTPRFNRLPSINQQANTYIHTPLSRHMSQLNLPEYASTDAAAFPGHINPDVKEEVLEKSKKEYYGPQVMGLGGALLNYDRKAIQQTASVVKKMKIGACHSFAQLAADHLLTSIEKGQLSPMIIKMVSYPNALGSHTFLLVDHVSSDLTDLSNCLIIDPWAVVMGHRSTYGVHTKEDYPFSQMLSKLVCCYDNRTSITSDKESKATNSSLSQELQSAVARRGFFSRRSAAPEKREENLNTSQTQAVQFISELTAMSGHGTKKNFMMELMEGVKSQKIPPEKAIRLAALVSQVRSIEEDGNHYQWKKLVAIDDSILSVFNDESIFPFWKEFIKSHGIDSINQNFKTIDISMLNKIINFLCENESLEFNKSMTIRNRI